MRVLGSEGEVGSKEDLLVGVAAAPASSSSPSYSAASSFSSSRWTSVLSYSVNA